MLLRNKITYLPVMEWSILLRRLVNSVHFVLPRISAACITDKTGMPASQILVAATHTHNGAETHGEEPLVDNAIQVNRVVEVCIKAAETDSYEINPTIMHLVLID